MRAMRVQCVMTVAVSVGLFGAPVVAQAPAGAVACHESQLFVAIGRDRLDEVGTDFIIRRKDKPDGKPLAPSSRRRRIIASAALTCPTASSPSPAGISL
jgi:hypothetical protein